MGGTGAGGLEEGGGEVGETREDVGGEESVAIFVCAVEEDVVGFDVGVDDAGGVLEGEASDQLGCYGQEHVEESSGGGVRRLSESLESASLRALENEGGVS